MNTKSKTRGKNTSVAEVSHVSAQGIWVLVDTKEYFLSYFDFPWFAEAKISDIMKLEFLHGCHLRWPMLDVDIELGSLEKPVAYPLQYR